MAFIGFVKKLNSTLFSKTVPKDGLFLLNGKEVSYCELCGVVINATPTSITVCDFFGLTELYKSASMNLEGKGPFVFTIKLYSKKGKVYGYCKNIRNATIYEEIAFNVEVKHLLSSLCY